MDRRQARPFVHGPVPLLVTEHSWPMEHRDAESDMPSSAVFVAQRVQASCFSERLSGSAGLRATVHALRHSCDRGLSAASRR